MLRAFKGHKALARIHFPGFFSAFSRVSEKRPKKPKEERGEIKAVNQVVKTCKPAKALEGQRLLGYSLYNW